MIRPLNIIISATIAFSVAISPCIARNIAQYDFHAASTGKIYFQPTPPLKPKDGEIWIDSRNGAQFYFLSGAWTFDGLRIAVTDLKKDNADLSTAHNGPPTTIADAQKGETGHARPISGHMESQSQLTALHEPQPLHTPGATETVATLTQGNGHSAVSVQTKNAATGAIATPVTPTAFHGVAKDKNEQNTQSHYRAPSNPDAPTANEHMSLTDALNADQLVDLLKAIGAHH